MTLIYKIKNYITSFVVINKFPLHVRFQILTTKDIHLTFFFLLILVERNYERGRSRKNTIKYTIAHVLLKLTINAIERIQ